MVRYQTVQANILQVPYRTYVRIDYLVSQSVNRVCRDIRTYLRTNLESTTIEWYHVRTVVRIGVFLFSNTVVEGTVPYQYHFLFEVKVLYGTLP